LDSPRATARCRDCQRTGGRSPLARVAPGLGVLVPRRETYLAHARARATAAGLEAKAALENHTITDPDLLAVVLSKRLWWEPVTGPPRAAIQLQCELGHRPRVRLRDLHRLATDALERGETDFLV